MRHDAAARDHAVSERELRGQQGNRSAATDACARISPHRCRIPLSTLPCSTPAVMPACTLRARVHGRAFSRVLRERGACALPLPQLSSRAARAHTKQRARGCASGSRSACACAGGASPQQRDPKLEAGVDEAAISLGEVAKGCARRSLHRRDGAQVTQPPEKVLPEPHAPQEAPRRRARGRSQHKQLSK